MPIADSVGSREVMQGRVMGRDARQKAQHVGEGRKGERSAVRFARLVTGLDVKGW